MSLTPRQRDVLLAIRELISRNGVSPTIQELSDHVGISRTAVNEHISALVNKGFVRRGDRHKARTIEPSDDELVSRTEVIEAVEKHTDVKRGVLDAIIHSIRAIKARR